jgi:hypothetical protein
VSEGDKDTPAAARAHACVASAAMKAVHCGLRSLCHYTCVARLPTQKGHQQPAGGTQRRCITQGGGVHVASTQGVCMYAGKRAALWRPLPYISTIRVLLLYRGVKCTPLDRPGAAAVGGRSGPTTIMAHVWGAVETSIAAYTGGEMQLLCVYMW